MTKASPTRKLLGKLGKNIPGISYFDPKEILGLSNNQAMVLDVVSSLILDNEKKKPGKRRQFSKLVKLEVLRKQNHRCKSCKDKLEAVDFDHIDGNSSNNDISNCQALCPNCHAKKSRKK